MSDNDTITELLDKCRAYRVELAHMRAKLVRNEVYRDEIKNLSREIKELTEKNEAYASEIFALKRKLSKEQD